MAAISTVEEIIIRFSSAEIVVVQKKKKITERKINDSRLGKEIIRVSISQSETVTSKKNWK